MTSEEIQAFLSKAHNAIIGINRATGGPQLTPVWYGWDGTSFFFSTTRDRTKYLNLKRDPAISLIVDEPATHTYIVAYGRAEILEKYPEDLLRSIVEKYLPAEQINSAVQGIINDPNRVLVRLQPEKLLSR
jgi:PPOX class probable F420-dependent enzyme